MCLLWPGEWEILEYTRGQESSGKNRAVFWTSCTDRSACVKLGQSSLLQPSQTSLPSLIISLCVSDLSTSPLKPFNHLQKSQDKNWTHVRIVTAEKPAKKPPNSHHIFQEFQRNESLSVLVSSSQYLKLIYFTAVLFTSSPLCLLWSQCEYWMEAADVQQAHALAEKQAAAQWKELSVELSRWSSGPFAIAHIHHEQA